MKYAVGWVSLVAATVLGCGSSTPSAPLGPTGTMIVTVAIPFNSTAQYVVSGPNAYAAQYTQTDTIFFLPVGVYNVQDATAGSIDPIVTGLYTGVITGSPVTINENDTGQASISYITTPGTGGLWVGSKNSGNPVAAEYLSQELQNSSPPGFTLHGGGATVVFDPLGNLWIASSTSNTISEYLAPQLVTGGSTIPAVTIGGSGLNGPSGLAFDRSGNLWVANASGNSIVQYTAIQLLSSGNPPPAVTLTSAALSNPGGLTFDASGSLWVPSFNTNTIAAFTAHQVASGGNQTPVITISANAGSLESPSALAFDEDGNLWAINQAGNTIVKYGTGQLLTGGSLVPLETLTVPGPYSGLSALAFDNSGDLWITCVTSSHLIVYDADQLVSSINTSPEQALSVAGAPTSLAFNPRQDGLPLGGLGNLSARLKKRSLPKL
jgi:sugar lactone lactonase YvrE